MEFAAIIIHGGAKSLLGDGVGHLILFNVEKFQRIKRPIGRLTCLTAVLQLFHLSFCRATAKKILNAALDWTPHLHLHSDCPLAALTSKTPLASSPRVDEDVHAFGGLRSCRRVTGNVGIMRAITVRS